MFKNQVWPRFRRNFPAMYGSWAILAILLMAVIGPYLSGYAYDEIHLADKNLSPSAKYWFGSDELGRDIFTRVWYGARISLFVGIAAALIDLVIGIVWGGIAAASGGAADEVLMRIADVLYSLPYLLIVIILTVALGSGLASLILAMTVDRMDHDGAHRPGANHAA